MARTANRDHETTFSPCTIGRDICITGLLVCLVVSYLIFSGAITPAWYLPAIIGASGLIDLIDSFRGGKDG